MMHPEDRVLVGVMKRAKDFTIAREQRWYRIPEGQAPKGIHAEYIAFFFSKSLGEYGSGIHFYARRTGLELATRAELIPDEPDHKNAAAVYHKLQFRELLAKVPPVLNPTKRRFAFIYTTWDRFVHATTIDDLYSEADHLVDRIYHTLEDAGLRPQRVWEAEANTYPDLGAHVRVLCEDGEVVASILKDDDFHIGRANTEQISRRIQDEVEKRGGPRTLSTPLD